VTREELLLAEGLGVDWPLEVRVGGREAPYAVRADGDGYAVRNPGGGVYHVTAAGRCNCAHYLYRAGPGGYECKHIFLLKANGLLGGGKGC